MIANEFRWNKASQQAAKRVAEDSQRDYQIAAEAGVHVATLERWKQHPDFRARVEEHRAAWRERVMQAGIADRARRIEALNDIYGRMVRVVEARAEAMPDDAPGSDTGLLVRQVKQIGAGRDAMTIEEYAVDTGTLKEMREHLKQAAQELGQWSEKRELTGKDGQPLLSLEAVQAFVQQALRGGSGA